MNAPCIKCGKECRPAYQRDGQDMYHCVACDIYVGRHMESGYALMVLTGERFDPEKFPYMKEFGEWVGLFTAK